MITQLKMATKQFPTVQLFNTKGVNGFPTLKGFKTVGLQLAPEYSLVISELLTQH